MRRWARGPLVLVGLILIWAITAEVVHSPLAPGPGDVVRAAVAAAKDGSLARAVLTTAARLVAGYAVALLAGVPIGVLLARSTTAREMLGPLVLGLSSVPSVCWLPLAILWFGLSEWAIQVVVVLGAMLPIAVATDSAVRNVSPQIHRAARTMGARGPRLLLMVTVPAAVPGILAGAKVGWTFAVRSLMAGELLFVSGGLGQLLETARDLGDTALVVAVIGIVVLLGRMIEWTFFGRAEREVARRWGFEPA